MSKKYLVIFFTQGTRKQGWAQFGEEKEMLDFLTQQSQCGSSIHRIMYGDLLEVEPVSWITEYKVRDVE